MVRMRWILLLAGCLLLPQAARASKPPPVSIRLHGEAAPPQPGQPFPLRVELLPAADGELSGFGFEGVGWTVTRSDAPAAVAAVKHQGVELRFELVAGPDPGPLTFVVEHDGHRVSRTFDLSPEALRRELEPGKLEVRPAEKAFAGVDRETLVPLPAGAATFAIPPDQPASPAGRWIRVYGRFVYVRDDGRLVGVDGGAVRVYDDDAYDDDLMGLGGLDALGHFDIMAWWDPAWHEDQTPDIYVDLEVNTSVVTVETTYLERNYHFRSPCYPDFGGSELWFQDLYPAQFSSGTVLQINNAITKAWRFLYYWAQEMDPPLSYNMPHVDVQYPEQGDNATRAWYNTYFHEIHLGETKGWLEDSATHEYGHHWMWYYGDYRDPQYWCNGFGDPPDCDEGNAGHARWCMETASDAVNEGVPNWLADVITRTYRRYYLYPASHLRDFEVIEGCPEDAGNVHDPLLTEGHMAAVLRDVEDGRDPYNPEEDPAYAGNGYSDRIERGATFVLQACTVSLSGGYPTPLDLLLTLRDQFSDPVYSGFWETAHNCGYEVDIEPPGTARQLVSTSHSLLGDSTDPTIDFEWSGCEDDLSGIAGYSIAVTPAAQGHPMPDETKDISGYSYTTGILAPGSYYFSIRALDRSGKWSPDYAWQGPYTIREMIPADLTFDSRAGWSAGAVVRGTDDSAPDYCPAPTLMYGNDPATWWNVCWINTGEEDWYSTWSIDLMLDGVLADRLLRPSTPPGVHEYVINWGPLTVPGGRHTTAVHLDSGDAIMESEEENNGLGRQWVWTPLTLEPGVVVQRDAPGDRLGGWEDLAGVPVKYDNCDGLSFCATGWWNAVVVEAVDQADDFDARLFPHAVGATAGFDATPYVCGWPAGWLDAVMVNRRQLGSGCWDVAVVNWPSPPDGPNDDYKAVLVTSQFVPLNTDNYVDIDWDQDLALREFYVDSANLGPLTIWLEGNWGFDKVWLLYFNRDFEAGGLSDYDLYARISADDRQTRLSFTPTQTGHHCVAIFRNPESGPRVDMRCTLRIGPTPPNPKYHFPAGWHSALVPRPLPDGTPTWVPEPSLLQGDAASTWLNSALYNQSPSPATGLTSMLRLDGQPLLASSYPPIDPYAEVLSNHTTAWYVHGGRHTLSLRIDEADALAELSEDDNVYGEQYVWQPTTLDYEVATIRDAPPERTAGLEDDPALFGPLHYNCDGVRMPSESAYYAGVAVMPGPGSDCDLRLHPLATDTKDGFADELVFSGWPVGMADYAIVNFNLTPFAQHDAGIVRVVGTEDYTVEAVASTFLAYYPAGEYGPYALREGHIMMLFEMYLPAGPLGVLLEDRIEGVDWGLALHAADTVYVTSETALPGGCSWLHGSGEDESIYVDVPQEGYHCLAVWKTRAADLDREGQFYLHFVPQATEAGPLPVLPSATGLASVRPNPLNPRTTVLYELARDARVELVVVDLRGRRVCGLVSGHMPAGRHEVDWDGRDDAGRLMASGVYLVRMTSDDSKGVDYRKVTLVK